MIKEAILKLSQGANLGENEARIVMDEIMEGSASNAQIAAFMAFLSAKGESVEEITAFAKSMRAHCNGIQNAQDALEIVGTGGDLSNSFNISTTCAFIVASAGVKIAKHGNRAASSKCGAADVLEALGANITLSPAQCAILLDKINFCFLYAPTHHSAMKYVAPVRKELGIKSVFNLLGPLTNPANANMELMGVSDEKLVVPLAKVLQNLGIKRGMVVCGMRENGAIDEISLVGETKICEICGDSRKSYTIHPRDFGYAPCKDSDLEGGSASENARILREILNGKEKGAKFHITCLNAGAALYIANKAPTIAQGVALAESLIAQGRAQRQLEDFINLSNELAK